MADLKGTVTFPGIQQILAAAINFGPGISPSSATIQMVPQIGYPAAGGDLEFSFAGETITFHDCRIVAGTATRGPGGLLLSLSIQDRRWKWSFGRVSGWYNHRQPDFTIDKDFEKKPSELADFCRIAMGEAEFAVNEMPDDARPEVNWDSTNPAQALASLAESLGCYVVLQLDNQVAIRKKGDGADLPRNNTIIDESGGIDPPEKPDAFAVVTGPRRFQQDFELEAVGLDTDGKIKKIDDLSYKPAGGWSTIDLPHFQNVSDTKCRDLAKATVFRWYRIKVPLTIHGLEKETAENRAPLDKLDRILPIGTTQVRQIAPGIVVGEIAAEHPEERIDRPAQVYGIYALPWDAEWAEDVHSAATMYPLPLDETEAAANGLTNYLKQAIVPQEKWSLDSERGIVRFSDYMFKQSATGTYLAAVLRLRTAVTLRDAKTNMPLRVEAIKGSEEDGSFKTKARVLRHDEIVPRTIAQYKPTTAFDVDKVTSNVEDVRKECMHYADAAEREYETANPQTIRYAGLQRVEIDGAVMQVSYSLDLESGMRTTASRNTEHARYAVSFREKRFLEKQKAELERAVLRNQFEIATKLIAGL